jgi:hypothetical protein
VSAVTADRLCECECGEPIQSSRPNARYASDACRTRAWKARTGYADRRARKPSRNGRPRRPSPSSVRISYRKALDVVESALRAQPMRGSAAARQRAEELLEPILTPAGRRALRG